MDVGGCPRGSSANGGGGVSGFDQSITLAEEAKTGGAIDILIDGLIKIAAFDDVRANERLNASGTCNYSAFDEPGSVREARIALHQYRKTVAAGISIT